MFDTAQFVFSFRSPYAWIAARWLLPLFPSDFAYRWRPFFPLPTFPNFPPPLPAKVHYLVRDVSRLVEHHGGTVRWPGIDDPNWATPHCAFLEAEARGRGSEFALAVFEARFGRGENVAEASVLAKAADAAALDAAAIVAAGQDKTSQDSLTRAIQEDFDEREIFGVPTLILPRGTRYWGHDRIEWAIREGRIR